MFGFHIMPNNCFIALSLDKEKRSFFYNRFGEEDDEDGIIYGSCSNSSLQWIKIYMFA